MRLMILAAVAAMTMTAQDVKPESGGKPAGERQLTETEVLKIRLSQEKIKNLQAEYKIAEYQEKLQPVAEEQRALYTAACRSVGTPEDKIMTECQFTTGYDQEDKPINGPDGKPVKGTVKWVKPEPAKK